MTSKSLCWDCRWSRKTSQLSSMRRRLLATPWVGLPIWVALWEVWVTSKTWTSLSSLNSYSAVIENIFVNSHMKNKKDVKHLHLYHTFWWESQVWQALTWWQMSAVSWTRLSFTAMCRVPVTYFPLLPMWLISLTKASYKLYSKPCHLLQSSAWAPKRRDEKSVGCTI